MLCDCVVQYDSLNKALEQYSNAAIIFGYMTIFIVALPMSTTFAFVSEIVYAKMDKWLLLRIYQRPVPIGAQDIGVWYDYTFMSNINLNIDRTLGLIFRHFH